MLKECERIKQLDNIIQLGRNYTQVNRDTSLKIIELAIKWSQDKTDNVWRNHYGRSLSSKGSALENEEGMKGSPQWEGNYLFLRVKIGAL